MFIFYQGFYDIHEQTRVWLTWWILKNVIISGNIQKCIWMIQNESGWSKDESRSSDIQITIDPQIYVGNKIYSKFAVPGKTSYIQQVVYLL